MKPKTRSMKRSSKSVNYRQTEQVKKQTQNTNICNKRGKITIESTDIERIIRDYYDELQSKQNRKTEFLISIKQIEITL